MRFLSKLSWGDVVISFMVLPNAAWSSLVMSVKLVARRFSVA
jgi:hypothetical protein